MEIAIWRLVKAERVDSAWDGEGAFRFGGRWNSRGVRVVYASSSLALALLEVLVHLDSSVPPPRLCAIHAQVSDEAVTPIEGMEKIPAFDTDAIRFPYSLQESRAAGDVWVRSQAGALAFVPSTIVPTESNFLLNPSHPAFSKIRIGWPREFVFDGRLTARPG